MQPRLTEYLQRRCLVLSAEDRAALAGQLIQSLDGDSPKNIPAELEKVRVRILEEYQVDVLDRCRMQPGPYLRAVFSHWALQVLPVSQSDVARYLGIRPCSVNYYERMVRDAVAVPGSNPSLMAIYQNIMKI